MPKIVNKIPKNAKRIYYQKFQNNPIKRKKTAVYGGFLFDYFFLKFLKKSERMAEHRSESTPLVTSGK